MYKDKEKPTPSIAGSASARLRRLINGNGEPKWFILLNRVSLLPIILWPLVFFGSIFMFDNPQDITNTYLLFFALNSYPFILLFLVNMAYKSFQQNKWLATLIPVTILTTFLVLFILLLMSDS